MFCVFILALSLCSTEGSILPTTQRELVYFTNVVHWNTAFHGCLDTGGRLIQLETALQNEYYKSILQKLRALTSSYYVEIWLGLVSIRPPELRYAWVDGCLPACYRDWDSGEPNFRSSDYCIRIRDGRYATYGWRTTNCSRRSAGFVCEHITNNSCNYDDIDETALTGSTFKTETLSTSKNDCKHQCDTRIRYTMECWGFTYHHSRRECKLVYIDDPYVLDKITYRTSEVNSGLHIKRCFQLKIRKDNIGNYKESKDPDTQCFKRDTSVSCNDLDAMTYSNNNSEQDSTLPPAASALTSTRRASLTFGMVPRSSERYITKGTLSDVSVLEVSATTTYSIKGGDSSTSSYVDGRTSSLKIGMESTSVGEVTPVVITDETCLCTCVSRHYSPQNVTKEEFKRAIIQDLEINKVNLSSTWRKRISVYEQRVIPITVGSVWIAVLAGIYGAIVISDLLIYGKTIGPRKPKSSGRGYGFGKRKVRQVYDTQLH